MNEKWQYSAERGSSLNLIERVCRLHVLQDNDAFVNQLDPDVFSSWIRRDRRVTLLGCSLHCIAFHGVTTACRKCRLVLGPALDFDYSKLRTLVHVAHPARLGTFCKAWHIL